MNIQAYEVPKILMTKETRRDIRIVTDAINKEITMMMEVERSGYDFVITKCYLPKQTVASATIDFDANALLDLIEEVEHPDLLKCHWHSHVDFGVSPSRTDDDQFKEWAEGSEDFFIQLISNKKGEFYCKFLDKERGLVFSDIPVYIQKTDEDERIAKQWKDLIAERVKEKKITTYVSKPYIGYNKYTSVGSTTKKKNNKPKTVECSSCKCLEFEDKTIKVNGKVLCEICMLTEGQDICTLCGGDMGIIAGEKTCYTCGGQGVV